MNLAELKRALARIDPRYDGKEVLIEAHDVPESMLKAGTLREVGYCSGSPRLCVDVLPDEPKKHPVDGMPEYHTVRNAEGRWELTKTVVTEIGAYDTEKAAQAAAVRFAKWARDAGSLPTPGPGTASTKDYFKGMGRNANPSGPALAGLGIEEYRKLMRAWGLDLEIKALRDIAANKHDATALESMLATALADRLAADRDSL